MKLINLWSKAVQKYNTQLTNFNTKIMTSKIIIKLYRSQIQTIGIDFNVSPEGLIKSNCYANFWTSIQDQQKYR